MKKINLFFLGFILLTLFAVNLTNAQTGFQKDAEEFSGAGYKTISTECIIDSTDTLYTKAIELAGYSKVLAGYELLNTLGDGTAKITILRQQYVFGDWRADKTLYTADSLETFKTFADTATSVKNRLVIFGASTNPDSVQVQLKYEIVPQ